MRTCLSFAWLNLVRGDRLRLAVALIGAAVAIFILLLHLALLRAVEHKATQVYALFESDIVLLSDRFQFLYRMSGFPAARLRQALSLPAVADAAAVRVSSGTWVAPRTGAASSLLVIGVDPDSTQVANAELRDSLTRLKAPRNVLFDRRANPDVGAVRVGDTGHIGSRPATVAGLYDLGLPMYAAATAIVANADFPLYTHEDAGRIQLGLLRLVPGSDARQVSDELTQLLPEDVRALPTADLMAREAGYFVEVKPLGIMMRAGLVIGLLVGAVSLFQVLSAQMESRMADFAVLRALGYSSAFTYAVGACQLLLAGAAAFGIAWLASVPVFDAIAAKSHLSMPLDAALLWTAVVLCLPMMASGGLPVLRAGRADPAALF